MADYEDNGLARIVSHGRGGAGNIGHDDPNQPVNDIKTIPTIKSPVYTTGRGGTGNMALNDPAHPEYARAAQDLEIAPPKMSTEIHGGRGGAGNILKPKDEEEALRREQEEREKLVKTQSKEPVDHSKIDYRGWADKGKDLLFGRKSK